MAEGKSRKQLGIGFYIILVAVFILALIAILIVFGHYFRHFGYPTATQEVFAQFGDYVGGILNPVLSFLTIALLIGSIVLQRMELGNVVEELNLTRTVHQSSLNMSHYQHIITVASSDSSDFKFALESVREYLEEKVRIDTSTGEEKEDLTKCTLFQIFSDDTLYNAICRKGYLAVGINTGKNEYLRFESKSELLNANAKTVSSQIELLIKLGCPKFQADAVLQHCKEFMDDYYYSSRVNDTYKKNMNKIPEFKKMIEVFEGYPDFPLPENTQSSI